VPNFDGIAAFSGQIAISHQSAADTADSTRNWSLRTGTVLSHGATLREAFVEVNFPVAVPAHLI
jgi:hypothetical protein